MIAVQEGLVSLDTPIVCYIKDFSVNSKFEEEPEKKITLRHLLSHRAGFTHEAPIGNNYQPSLNRLNNTSRVSRTPGSNRKLANYTHTLISGWILPAILFK